MNNRTCVVCHDNPKELRSREILIEALRKRLDLDEEPKSSGGWCLCRECAVALCDATWRAAMGFYGDDPDVAYVAKQTIPSTSQGNND